jgi:lipoprotein-anchoring transpeptidase ErfK/SrfK
LFVLSTCAALTLVGVLVFSAGRVPPGASVLGIDLGLMTQADAATELDAAFTSIRLRDGDRVWTANPIELGIMLDSGATAARAADTGLGGLFGSGAVAPVISVNETTLAASLQALRSQVELPARNAGVRLVDGTVAAVPAANGRALDLNATVAQVASNPSRALMTGTLNLVMTDVAPTVTDAASLVAQAQALLASPLKIDAYDPFDGETLTWAVPPGTWAGWLTAESDPASALGLRLALDENTLADYLTTTANATLASNRYIETDAAVSAVSAAIADLRTSATVRVYEGNRTHTVQSGESITSIAYDYGIPYPYIQQANPNVNTLNAGQSLVIPSRDVFLEFDPVPDKRIVVSISGNWTRVYENGALKWDWVSSTGINSSPTWPGVYQIISHEPDAYAANWNLNMPWFMGVYKPVPGSEFTNGFHGFPTRGGGQILWENSLGTKVTYGCILLSNTNARALYDWAENGVVVEILP